MSTRVKQAYKVSDFLLAFFGKAEVAECSESQQRIAEPGGFFLDDIFVRFEAAGEHFQTPILCNLGLANLVHGQVAYRL